MRTEKLYDADSHLKKFTATVVSCEQSRNGYAVILDRTAFFPEGGGQASDRGTLGDAQVTDVQITDEAICHFTDRPLKVGETVTGILDWDRRFDYMQQHSGEHIVSGIAHRLYGAENVGFHLGDDTVTVDFDLPLNREQILKIETEANAAIYRNAAFRTYYPDPAVLSSLSYRSKKELSGDIRIVEIEGVDRCACCAPHVAVAGEIGVVKLLDPERLRGGVRLILHCGRRALMDYNAKYENTRAIGALLSAKQHETAQAVARLYEQLNAEKQKNTTLKRRLTDLIVETSGTKTVLFEDGFDLKEIQLLADALHRKSGRFCAVFSENGNGFAFAICAEAEEADRFFADFRTKFPVRGGGRGGMIQGTVTAGKEQLTAFFDSVF